jgi:hypothetical protein
MGPVFCSETPTKDSLLGERLVGVSALQADEHVSDSCPSKDVVEGLGFEPRFAFV